MNKLKIVLKYFIIAVLFAVTVSMMIPVKTNAADADDPYRNCAIVPIKPIKK